MIDWSQAIRIEQEVARIIAQQEYNGVLFNQKKAEEYVEYLTEEREKLYQQIRPSLSLEVLSPYNTPVNNPFLKSGDLSKSVKLWYDNQELPDINGPFSRVDFVEPDLGKRQKLIKQLLKLGWRPTEYTPITDKGGGGNPKITEDSFDNFEGDIGKQISKWYIYRHRQSQIEGWLKHARLKHDGRLPAGAIPLGTNTQRMRHICVVNVPKASDSVIFGKEMRSLFHVPEDMVMVGHDASGLELRMLAHYINDPNYTDVIINGDIHSLNQKMAGLPTRDDAKTFIYGWLYGAGDAKIGQIVNGTSKDGKRLKAQFLKANPYLKRLITNVKRGAKKGYLKGLDGRKVYIRSEHSALNVLLQSAGAILMKYSMVFLDKWVTQEGLRVKKIIDMHDEAQAEVHPDDVERYKYLAIKSLERAGTYLKINCPITGEAKEGRNWAQTH